MIKINLRKKKSENKLCTDDNVIFSFIYLLPQCFVYAKININTNDNRNII